MHHLVVPEALSSSCVERDQGIAEQVFAFAVAAEEVVRRWAERQEHHSPLLIHAHRRPDVCAAAIAPSASLPRRAARLARRGNTLEFPQRTSGSHIERLNDTSRSVGRTLLHTRAHDDAVAIDCRGGGHRIQGRRPAFGVLRSQVDATIRSEVSAQPSGIRIEAHEVTPQRAVEQPAPRAAGLCAFPKRRAAKLVVRPFRFAGLRIERPTFRACVGVERDHPAGWRDEVERIADDEWRRFEGGRLTIGADVGEAICFADVVRPGALQLPDVRRRQLRERRESRPAGITTVTCPLAALSTLLRRNAGKQQRQDQPRCSSAFWTHAINRRMVSRLFRMPARRQDMSSKSTR